MLKGEQVALRAIEKKDLEQLLIWRNQPEFRQYFREYRELNSENQLYWFEHVVMKDEHTRMFAIIDKSTEELLGACGLCYIDWINCNADFSIYIGKDNCYIDDLYAVDAAKIMIKYAFHELNLHRLWSEVYDFDKKKKKMFAVLGFVQEAVHKHTHWTNGNWCDSVYYRLIKGEENNT